MDAGTNHACAVVGGLVYCWGDNSKGQAGGSAASYTTAQLIPSPTSRAMNVKEIELGANASCGVAEGTGYCWGDAYTTGGASSVPVAVSGGALPADSTVSDIALGLTSGCLTADGRPYCWGQLEGQLGNGTTDASAVPVLVDTAGEMGRLDLGDLSVGGEFACATAADHPGVDAWRDQTFCWGDDSRAQLGRGWIDPPRLPALIPVRVMGPLVERNIVNLDLRGSTACAIDVDGETFCWGTT
ncbi:hypothetical protein NKG05_09105 [Oerskovia sp. M15]